MSRRYTPEEKSAILAKVQFNRGDISLTHLQTGIPERTLYAWRREEIFLQRQQQHTISSLPQQSSLESPDLAQPAATTLELSAFENDLEAIKFVRSRIMQELLNLSTSLGDDSGVASPYHRVLILSCLLERLKKLDDHLEPYIPAEKVIKIVRVQKPYVNKDFVWPPDSSQSDLSPQELYDRENDESR
jgi:transposase-like protein